MSLLEPERHRERPAMIRKLTSGKYRLYSRKKDPKTGAAPQSRHLRVARRRGAARARGAVFQAALEFSFRSAGAISGVPEIGGRPRNDKAGTTAATFRKCNRT